MYLVVAVAAAAALTCVCYLLTGEVWQGGHQWTQVEGVPEESPPADGQCRQETHSIHHRTSRTSTAQVHACSSHYQHTTTATTTHR